MAVDPTTDRREHAHLERHDHWFRQILENLREIIWVATPDFRRLVYVNPAYLNVWGRTPESLREDPLAWVENVHPDDRQTVDTLVDRARSPQPDETPLPAFRIFRDDGNVRWIRARLFRLDANQGRGGLAVIIAQDVTRRQFFEAALRESEEKWRSLLENAPDTVLLTDLNGHLLFANRDFMGAAKAELMGKHLLSLIPGRFSRTVVVCLDRVVSSMDAASCHIEHIDAKGNNRFYALRMSPVIVGGLTVAVAVNAMDVTERVMQERTLMESDAFHRTLFEESPTGISIQDFSAVEAPLQQLRDSGITDIGAYLAAHPDVVQRLADSVKIVRVNQATVDLYRAPDAASMVGPLSTLLQPGDDRHFIDQLIAFTEGGDRYEGEARNRDHHGNTLHLMIRKVVINRAEHGLAKVMASLVDLTPIKATEKERATLMLQLQQAQKMEAIGTLAGGVAHDFNNILSIIMGNAELAKADITPTHPVHRNIQEICTASMRAKSIVQQLLGFSRRSEQILKPIHLIPLVKEAVHFMRATIPANIAIHTQLTAGSDIIRADATQIHQILINLLTNAGHAMEKNGGSLTVQSNDVTLDHALRDAILSVPAGRYVRVTVSDTGDGIPQAAKDRIFDPYFTTKSAGKGTGMGLAVVHGIVKSYGGGIVVESEPGQGTTFTLYFPLVEEMADMASPGKQAVPTGNERILFVDDEAMIVEIAEKMLTRLGYRVQTCNDPARALTMLAEMKGAVDLLITDMAMPGMTGDQLIEHAHRLLPSLPVILCTGHTERVPKDNPHAMGIAAMLDKPVTLNTLAVTVRKVLDRQKRTD